MGLCEDNALREALAEALRSRNVWWAAETDGPADALLPVVTAYAERRARVLAAKELRAAADDRHGEQCCGGPCADDLRDRADALAADDRTGRQ